MKKLLLLLLASVLLLTSCVTRSPFKSEHYFQAMGLDGQFVFTVNAQLLDISQFVQTDDSAISYIADRMDRLSISMDEDNHFYGAIEGRYPKTIVNTALNFSKSATKIRDSETGLKYYKLEGSSVEASMPSSGIILFSNDSVVENYISTVKERTKMISDEDAAKLASSQLGFYVANPKTMIDMGFDIPQSALSNISNVLLVMDNDTVSIDFTLKTEELAKSFSVIIKAGYVARLKKEGQSVNISELKNMFTEELEKVSVNDMKLNEQQLSAIEAMIFSLLDTML